MKEKKRKMGAGRRKGRLVQKAQSPNMFGQYEEEPHQRKKSKNTKKEHQGRRRRTRSSHRLEAEERKVCQKNIKDNYSDK